MQGDQEQDRADIAIEWLRSNRDADLTLRLVGGPVPQATYEHILALLFGAEEEESV